LKLRGDCRRSQIDPADHPEDSVGGACQFEEELGFVERSFGLDGDGTVDVILFKFVSEISGEKIALEHRHGFRNPGMVARIVLPEMLVGVDDHLARSGWAL